MSKRKSETKPSRPRFMSQWVFERTFHIYMFVTDDYLGFVDFLNLPEYNLEKFGIYINRPDVGDYDVLLVAGDVTYNQIPLLKEIYNHISDPKMAILIKGEGRQANLYNIVENLEDHMKFHKVYSQVSTDKEFLRTIVHIKDFFLSKLK